MDENFENLETFGKNIKELSETQSVPLTEIYSDSFFQENTSFQSFQAFLEKGGFTINTEEDLDKIEIEDLDKFTSENTSFKDFKDLKDKAIAEFTTKMLFKNFK